VISRKVTEHTEDEEVLIRRAQDDPRCFRPLYEKYFKKIFLFIHHRVGEKSLSADITSQVFLKAMSHLSRFRFRGLPFSAWLYRIALNECHDFFRKTKRYRFVAADEYTIEKFHEEFTAETGLAELHERLPEILERLTRDELHIIELRFFEQRPFKEVADILGITETYAKVKVYRTLDKMKKMFLRTL
jgi:RNA polymerase sigma-70 factor, ECF subfamily